MGEVWRAFDLRLRVEVALKALRPELLGDPRVLDLVRNEVLAARQVHSPNVRRIFDLVEADGRELVSMEFIDGETLLEVLRRKGPPELGEATDIASVGFDDRTIRVWDVPDLAERPFHTLPRDLLLDRLRAFTNLRVISDEDEPDGHRIKAQDFHGWDRQVPPITTVAK